MTDKKDTVLIVPTIRENCLNDFIDRWHALKLFDHVDLMVMEDNPSKTFDSNHVAIKYHYCWKNIEEDLGKDQWIIPRRSDTVRSYAYWKAAVEGYEFIMTLDDDCYPPGEEEGFAYESGEQFVNLHKRCLSKRSKWFNTLNGVKPRGFPFYNIGERNDIIVNHGLWTNVLDYDAPTQLVDPKEEKFNFSSSVVPHGSYFPMCGMNVMWRGDYTVLMYHLLMGKWFARGRMGELLFREEDDNGVALIGSQIKKLPFDRFGDIWCGIFMKKIADSFSLSVSTGIPYIRHERASNPFTNLKKEANGLEVNEDMWEYVDQLDLHYANAGTVAEAYKTLGEHIGKFNKYPEYVEYFTDLGKAMVVWSRLFQQLEKSKHASVGVA